MPWQSSVFGGPATSLELRYTSKPVSGWGGLLAVMRYFERRGIRQQLQSVLPDGRTSPNQIDVFRGPLRTAFAERLSCAQCFLAGLSPIPASRKAQKVDMLQCRSRHPSSPRHRSERWTRLVSRRCTASGRSWRPRGQESFFRSIGASSSWRYSAALPVRRPAHRKVGSDTRNHQP
jgi:hypothetical protein